MNIYELESQATSGPVTAVTHLGRATVLLGGHGGPIANFEHVMDDDKSANDIQLLAHCRNNFIEALEGLKRAADILADIYGEDELPPPKWIQVLIKKLEDVK